MSSFNQTQFPNKSGTDRQSFNNFKKSWFSTDLSINEVTSDIQTQDYDKMSMDFMTRVDFSGMNITPQRRNILCNRIAVFIMIIKASNYLHGNAPMNPGILNWRNNIGSLAVVNNLNSLKGETLENIKINYKLSDTWISSIQKDKVLRVGSIINYGINRPSIFTNNIIKNTLLKVVYIGYSPETIWSEKGAYPTAEAVILRELDIPKYYISFSPLRIPVPLPEWIMSNRQTFKGMKPELIPSDDSSVRPIYDRVPFTYGGAHIHYGFFEGTFKGTTSKNGSEINPNNEIVKYRKAIRDDYLKWMNSEYLEIHGDLPENKELWLRQLRENIETQKNSGICSPPPQKCTLPAAYNNELITEYKYRNIKPIYSNSIYNSRCFAHAEGTSPYNICKKQKKPITCLRLYQSSRGCNMSKETILNKYTNGLIYTPEIHLLGTSKGGGLAQLATYLLAKEGFNKETTDIIDRSFKLNCVVYCSVRSLGKKAYTYLNDNNIGIINIINGSVTPSDNTTSDSSQKNVGGEKTANTNMFEFDSAVLFDGGNINLVGCPNMFLVEKDPNKNYRYDPRMWSLYDPRFKLKGMTSYVQDHGQGRFTSMLDTWRSCKYAMPTMEHGFNVFIESLRPSSILTHFMRPTHTKNGIRYCINDRFFTNFKKYHMAGDQKWTQSVINSLLKCGRVKAPRSKNRHLLPEQKSITGEGRQGYYWDDELGEYLVSYGMGGGRKTRRKNKRRKNKRRKKTRRKKGAMRPNRRSARVHPNRESLWRQRNADVAEIPMATVVPNSELPIGQEVIVGRVRDTPRRRMVNIAKKCKNKIDGACRTVKRMVKRELSGSGRKKKKTRRKNQRRRKTRRR